MAVLSTLLNPLWSVLVGAWETFFLAAPFLLLGLTLAGLLHVLISRRLVERWMGGEGLGAVSKAAALGVPLPICSCGIVPVSIELQRKGASRPANLSFLITTPESSADAILLTWAMLGPLVAIVRPLASFFTALIAGVLAIAQPEEAGTSADARGGNGAQTGSTPAGHEPGEPHIHTLEEDEAEVVGPRGLWRALVRDLGPRLRRRKPGAEDAPRREAGDPPPLGEIARRIGHYAFIELLDDILFWLLLGFLLAGGISALVPAGLGESPLGSGLGAMLLMLVVGIPIYTCASASTPIGAALVAKGVSPGAALVFLLSGPATNAATLVLLTRHFSRSFVRAYLVSIAVGALAAGLALDLLLGVAGWKVTASLSADPGGLVGGLHWLTVLIFLGLTAWRLKAGAGRRGWRESQENLQGLVALLRGGSPGDGEVAARPPAGLSRRRLTLLASALLLAAYLSSGLSVVPADSVGFRVTFGRVASQPLAPGLHYAAPWPVGELQVWPVGFPRKADVGFRTDLQQIAKRKELMLFADPSEWHSPVAAMNKRPDEVAFIAGDENLLELSLTVHYVVRDAYRFYYRFRPESDTVALYAQAVARELVAARALDDLLTGGRPELEEALEKELTARLEALDAGVEVVSVHVVDLHPPQDAVFAFRDVSSAREDRETRVNEAQETLAREVPRARGGAVITVAEAQAVADAARVEASGRAESFEAQADAFADGRGVLGDLLWLETAERVLAGRPKIIVPRGSAGQGVVLWREAPTLESPAAPLRPKDRP